MKAIQMAAIAVLCLGFVPASANARSIEEECGRQERGVLNTYKQAQLEDFKKKFQATSDYTLWVDSGGKEGCAERRGRPPEMFR